MEKRIKKIRNKIRNKTNGKVEGCVIANRSPLGLNFSFLENRSYYILKKKLNNRDRLDALKCMNNGMLEFYKGFDLGSIPILTDPKSSKLLQKINGKFLREYMQSIWVREGFQDWHDHIDAFLMRIRK